MRIVVAGNSLNPLARGGELRTSKPVSKYFSKLHECLLLYAPPPTGKVSLVARELFQDTTPILTNYYRQSIKNFKPDAALLFGDTDTSILKACLDLGVPTALAIHGYWPLCRKSSFWNNSINAPCRNLKPALRNCDRCLIDTLNSKKFINILYRISRRFGLPSLMYYSMLKERERVKQADIVITPSNFLKEALIKELAMPDKKFYHIFGGIDPNSLTPSKNFYTEDKKTILFTGILEGQLAELKGFRHFLQLARALKDRTDFEFIATGGYPPGDIGKVKCLGHLPRNDLIRLYQNSYLLVVPSIWEEPFGLVAVEAMACGRPVVAYDSGGLPEIIVHNETGLLVPRGDIDGLVNSVEQLGDNEDEAAQMGIEGRKRVEKMFTITRICKDYLRVMEKLGNNSQKGKLP